MDLLGDDQLLNLRNRTDSRNVGKMPAQNDALASWQEPGEDATCHMCDHDGSHRCADCKQPACAAHSWVMFGLCKSCATPEQVARWNKERAVEDRNWLEEP